MARAIGRWAAVAFLLFATTGVAAAGGWATVRLDEPPGSIEVGTPWRVGFTVRQHDVTPVNVDAARLVAQHRETEEKVAAIATQEGAVGHYVADVTFSMAGEWKWSITPEPFAETSFEALTVVDDARAAVEVGAEASARAATGSALRLVRGSCPPNGRDLVIESDIPLVPEIGSNGLKRLGAPKAEPVWMGIATGDIPLGNLLGGHHALAVEGGGRLVACGAVGGPFDGEELVVGRAGASSSDPAGVAVLRQAGEKTEVRVVLTGAGVARVDADPVATGGPVAAVEIASADFAPSNLNVPPGTTVTWTNRDAIVHTVTSDDLAFADSGPLDLDGRFSQTFDQPGLYHYRCGPHPAMTGTITVG